MKRMTLGALLVFIILFNIGCSRAEEGIGTHIKVVLDGQEVVFEDQQPVIVEGRTLVPVRKIFEMLGFTVEWDGKNKKITGEKVGKRVELYINNEKSNVNGQEVELDVSAKIINNRTMVPLRFIVETCDKAVNYKEESKTVVINIESYVDFDLIKSDHLVYMNGKKIDFKNVFTTSDTEQKLYISLKELATASNEQIFVDDKNKSVKMSIYKTEITVQDKSKTAIVKTPLETYYINSNSACTTFGDEVLVPIDMFVGIYQPHIQNSSIYFFNDLLGSIMLKGERYYYDSKESKSIDSIEGKVVGYTNNGMEIWKEDLGGRIYVYNGELFYQYTQDMIDIAS
ncbi:MAG TPA: hypothetical protein DEP72_02740 [Clostridiales bacterium]|nr:MAG: hypothetical protein A2Y18_08165 [Clostridiales bacterium GWD2_32_19]HCC07072.1 hypothetical protein [Clostridiales bacterium]